MDINTPTYQIHVFGDAQARLYGSPYLQNYVCNVFFLGPVTLQAICRDAPTLDELKERSRDHMSTSYPHDDTVRDGDVVLFAFAADLSGNLDPDALTTDVMEVVLQQRQHHPQVKFGVQSVMPLASPDPGAIQTVQTLNQLLQTQCTKHGLLFVDLATYYQNDAGPYPVHGLCEDAEPHQLDTRVQDADGGVLLTHPEGITYAFHRQLALPVNIRHRPHPKKCKYPIELNLFQRNAYIKVRQLHYLIMFSLIAVLFLPRRYLLFAWGFWAFVLVQNIFVWDCFWNWLEFRLSNGNDLNILSEFSGVPREYQAYFSVFWYVFGLSLMTYRTWFAPA